MTIAEWLKTATEQIARLDAELLLTHYLKVADRSYLVAHSEQELPNHESLNELLERRKKGEPLAYILGYRDFYGRRFFVTPDTLIPRPETEDIITLAKTINPQNILDVGTGSGCIAITLALELPNTAVAATDISDNALSVAQKNAAHFNAKVDFRKSNLLSNYKPEPNTLIIANLPYVDREWQWLDHNSLRFEPETALFAENNGLALIYELIKQAPSDCELILEADPCQHEAIINYANSQNRKLKQQQNFILYFTKQK